MDRLTPEQRHRNMKNIKSSDTKPEITLRKILWANGIRYRKNYKILPGKPDIAITKYKIAVFCDSEFFHGKDWDEVLRPQLERGKNSEFWINKISRNIERDREVDAELRGIGWSVIRFRNKTIMKNPEYCVLAVKEKIFDTVIGGNDVQIN